MVENASTTPAAWIAAICCCSSMMAAPMSVPLLLVRVPLTLSAPATVVSIWSSAVAEQSDACVTLSGVLTRATSLPAVDSATSASSPWKAKPQSACVAPRQLSTSANTTVLVLSSRSVAAWDAAA